jgi:hypothetical protein
VATDKPLFLDASVKVLGASKTGGGDGEGDKAGDKRSAEGLLDDCTESIMREAKVSAIFSRAFLTSKLRATL